MLLPPLSRPYGSQSGGAPSLLPVEQIEFGVIVSRTVGGSPNIGIYQGFLAN
jgi:hypothetical protein